MFNTVIDELILIRKALITNSHIPLSFVLPSNWAVIATLLSVPHNNLRN